MSDIETGGPQPQHGIHETTPAMTWDEGLPLGSGILGAIVWGDGQPLNISLDRTDLWDLRPVPEYHSPEYAYRQMKQWHDEGRTEDLVRLYEAPYSRAEAPTKIPAGRIEITFGGQPAFRSADLSLADALASVLLEGGAQAEVLVHARQPLGMARIRSKEAPAIRLKAPAFGGKGESGQARADGTVGEANSLLRLGYPPPAESSGDNWRSFTQQGSQGFHFAVYAAWQDGKGERAIAWSIASSFEGENPLEIARGRVKQSLRAGFGQMKATHRSWWNRYWQQSAIRIPNKIIERQWYLEQYKFGAASRRGAPPITLQGPWTADNGGIPPWKGDYHHDLNTQLSYWPCYSANRLEEGLSFLDWLWKTRDNCFDWTRRFFEMPGLNVPMTADLNNNQMGGWRQYTHSATTAAWLSQHFYLHWRYSQDSRFLRERAYPYLKDAAIFIEAITSGRDKEGKRALPLSASPEINDNRPDAWFKTITNYDLALIRWLFQATAELADRLNRPEEAARWRSALSEMPDFACAEDGRLLVARDFPLPLSHRHFSHLMAIHPLGLIDWDGWAGAQQTIRASLEELDRLGPDWWCGYSYAWLGNLKARARDGQGAEKAVEIFSTAFTLRSSFHCNGDQSGKGYSKMTYRPFTLEGNFAAAAGVQEMLLQSQGGKIRIFPAVPEAWQDIAFTNLRAEGAFLVSARRVAGRTDRVDIRAEKGGACVLESPFTGKEIMLYMKPDERMTLTEDL
ncbi:MAG: glycoside hydrolase N-terminal domain-containing protein [Armatimonadetes bacterium]|nr:glycoside hydrolase N-terminal domain-containing protein [Armatimonadota bacterium]